MTGTVTDGQALLAAAERLQPDLVITEVALPGLDGIEATRRLQATVPGVKVLILSAHAEASCVRAAFDAGDPEALRPPATWPGRPGHPTGGRQSPWDRVAAIPQASASGAAAPEPAGGRTAYAAAAGERAGLSSVEETWSVRHYTPSRPAPVLPGGPCLSASPAGPRGPA